MGVTFLDFFVDYKPWNFSSDQIFAVIHLTFFIITILFCLNEEMTTTLMDQFCNVFDCHTVAFFEISSLENRFLDSFFSSSFSGQKVTWSIVFCTFAMLGSGSAPSQHLFWARQQRLGHTHTHNRCSRKWSLQKGDQAHQVDRQTDAIDLHFKSENIQFVFWTGFFVQFACSAYTFGGVSASKCNSDWCFSFIHWHLSKIFGCKQLNWLVFFFKQPPPPPPHYHHYH